MVHVSPIGLLPQKKAWPQIAQCSYIAYRLCGPTLVTIYRHGAPKNRNPKH